MSDLGDSKGVTVTIKDLVKRFGSVVAVDHVSCSFEPGKITVLLGPSGCGKSTTLRCVAGLEEPDSGEIYVDGEPITHVPVEKRNVGMVFQSYAIWPHMKLFENVAYPLMTRKVPKQIIKEKVSRVLKLVELQDLENRYATQLSGGQQQRVALARALVHEPKILLLDEPLSNLDARLRERARFETRDLQRRIGATAVYVTHDQAEAMVLADTLVVMNEGRIIQKGTPHEIYMRPNCKFVAQFIGSANLVPGQVRSKPLEGYGLVEHEGIIIYSSFMGDTQEGESVIVSVRPEDIKIARQKPVTDINVWEGKIEQIVFLGNLISCTVKIGDLELSVQLEKAADFRVGERIHVQFLPDNCFAFALRG